MPDNKNNQAIELTTEDDRWNDVLTIDVLTHTLNAICADIPSNHPFQIIADNFEVSVTLGDDNFIQNINKEWRDKDKPTNVLSFPQFDDIEEETSFLPQDVAPPIGDIFIAYDTVEKESREQRKSLKDHSIHMFVHGFLHLIGYDHIDNDEAEIMEALEIKILKRINIANPYETMYTD